MSDAAGAPPEQPSELKVVPAGFLRRSSWWACERRLHRQRPRFPVGSRATSPLCGLGYQTTGPVQLAVWRATGHTRGQLLIASEPELPDIGFLDGQAGQGVDAAAEQPKVAGSPVGLAATVRKRLPGANRNTSVSSALAR